MNTIIWKGVPSTNIEGLLICELPSISKPPLRVSETTIDGRDGSIIEDLGYSSYDKSITIGLYGNFNINNVIKYFTGEGDIIFSNEPDKVYSAKIIGQIDYNRLLRFRTAVVSFRVQPFKHKYLEAYKETPTATAEGTSIVVTDSADARLKAFSIYGKTTQDGTPTPDAPVELVSLGADGSVGVTINGLNLFNLNSGIISGTSQAVAFIDNGFVLDASSQSTRICRFKCNLTKGNTYFLSCDIKNVSGTGEPRPYLPKIEQYLVVGRPFTPEEDTDELGFFVSGANIPTVAEITNIQVSLTSEKKDYEPFAEQLATMALPNGLAGIPVTSGGNYTDANGQQWICDEIDLVRGVYVQRTYKYTVNGSGKETYAVSAVQNVAGATRFDISTDAPRTSHQICLCNAYTGTVFANAKAESCWCNDEPTTPSLQFRIATAQATTAEEMKALLQTKPIEVVYILATPIETALTEEEIATYKAMKSNEPSTTFLNDANAHMKVEYFKPFEVFNEGLENSKPLIVLRGSGTVGISVNGIHIFDYTFPDGEKEVVIDSEKEDAYLGEVLKNRNMNGEFPVLLAGTNKIEWSGYVESIEILPRSRWL